MSDVPLDASSIPRRTFTVSRRGFDQHEVRAYLHQLSELIGRLQRVEHSLLERAERAETRAELAEQLDEHRLIELVGEETARVLEAAKAAAGDIRAKAEERAARLVRDGQEEIAKLRATLEAELSQRREEIEREAGQVLEQARTELERRSAEAREAAAVIRAEVDAEIEAMRAEASEVHNTAKSEAEAILEAARQEGRRMVAEAQAVRERVLRDLARRRRTARAQVERLNAGRERLVDAYETVKRTVEEAMEELTVALPEARAAAEAAARRVDEEAEATVEQLEAEIEAARLVDLPLVESIEAELRELDEAERDGVVDDADHDDGAPADTASASPASVTPDAEVADASTTDAPAPPLSVDEPDRGAGNAATDAATVSEPADDRERSVDVEPGRPQAVAAVVEEASERRSSSLRLFRRREHLPVDMKGVPDEALVPVETAAEFEDVRVVEVETPAQSPDDTPAAAEHEPAVEAPAGELVVDEETEGVDAEGDDVHGKPSVDELFARLRAQRADSVAQAQETLAEADSTPAESASPSSATDAPTTPVAAGDTTEPAAEPDEEAEVEVEAEAEVEAEVEGDAAVLAQRDTDLQPIEQSLAKKLKRLLSDEQNVVLDAIRRSNPKRADDVLPTVAEHAQPYVDAATDALQRSAAAGVALVDSSSTVKAGCDDLAAELARGLVTPLRERIERSFEDTDGDLDVVSERLRALYREWKGQRVSEAVRHFTVASYARGVFDAAPSGCGLRWVVDTGGDPCPDADDNALAGAVVKGSAFPTGDVVPPAHPGCRCLALPERQ